MRKFLHFLQEKTGTQRSLQRLIFWSFVTVIFIPMLLIGGIVIPTVIFNTIKTVQNEMVAISSLKESAIDRWLENVVGRLTEKGTVDIATRTLYEFERRPDMEEHHTSRFRHDILAIRGNSSDFEWISVLETDGTVKASTNLDEIGKSYATDIVFQQGLAAPYIQPLSFDSDANEAVLYVSAPVLSSDEESVGVLLGKVSTIELVSLLEENTGLEEGTETYSVTEQGDVLSPQLKLRPDVQLVPKVVKPLLNNQPGAGMYRNYSDLPVVGAYRPLQYLGGALMAEQSQRTAFGVFNRLVFAPFLLSIIILGAALHLSYRLSRRITTPLRELTRATTAIAEGNLEQTVTLDRQDEIGTLAEAVNHMTGQLNSLITDLEDRVAERTMALEHRGAQLQTAIEVAGVANTILDQQELVQQTVELVKSQFNFYYVGLFLVDDENQWAVLQAGTGEAGRVQLENSHRLRLDESSMIGWCVTHGEAHIVSDVIDEEHHFVNPLLPETRSEMALPLISRGTTIGAITVQSTKSDAFSQEDIDVLQTVADQIALALRNSQLFSQMQAIQARFEDLYNRAPAGYHTLAPDGSFLEINDTALTMLGRQDNRETILQSGKITQFMTAPSQARFDTVLNQQLRRGRRVTGLELTYLHQNGSHIPLLMNAAPEQDAHGNLREIYISVQDIRRQKEAEAAREALLQQTETLYALNQQLLLTQNKGEIYQAGMNAVQTLSPSRGAAILMYGDANFSLEMVAAWQNPDNASLPPLLLPETLNSNAPLRRLLRSGETLLSANAASDVHFPPSFRQLCSQMRIAALVGSAIWRGGEVIGLLLVANHTDTPFAPEEIRLIEGMSRQLSLSLESLDHLNQALRRSTQLEAAAQIAKNTTTETDLAVLLPRVVDLVQNTFNYYHASLFLVDDYQQFAVLHAATGEAGKTLLAENYKLSLEDSSQVAVAIGQAELQNTANVTESNTFLRHPLLSETQSEITLPLIARNQVIGALDVQSMQVNGFSAEAETVLQTIADQVANAIYVARLFEREREAGEEISALHRRYLDQEWEDYLQSNLQPEKTSFALLPSAQIDGDLLAGETLLATLNPAGGTIPSGAITATIDGESAAIAPLTLRDTFIGAMGLVDDASRQWTDEEIAILEAVSAQTALAIENARLIEETQDWVHQLQTAFEINQAITATLNVDHIVADSLNLIQDRFELCAAHLYLLAGDSDSRARLYRNQGQGQTTAPSPDLVSLHPNSLTAQSMAQRQMLWLDYTQQAQYSLPPVNPADAQSALALPLLAQQNPVGVLVIFSHHPGAFRQEHRTVLEILAAQIAVSISNARAYQEQQETSAKLREVDKLKTQFLANMSHELRTPLNSIIGFSRVILKGIDGPLTELQKTDLTSIHESGKHLLELINNILNLAKIEAGKLEMNFNQVDLRNLITSITSTAKGLVKDKSIEIIEESPPHLPSIEADETRLRQVLLNLVSNAAKFTMAGSITIAADATDQHVTIIVKDSGIGIAPEDIESIFDEFTQVDASSTRRAGGTGLGLPITKRLIELHHGDIRVESALETGATFTVTLPLRQPDSPEAPSAGENGIAPIVPESANGNSNTLLVVDRDPRLLEYYRNYLQGQSLEVVGVHESGQVVSAVKSLQPYAILMDVLLPDTDGWKLLAELKQTPHTAHIPVIITSVIEDRFRAQKLGALEYLVKPVIKSDLLNALNAIQRHNRNARRVLVVDDRADDILLIRRILESKDCQVVSANNGLDGLDIINSHPPELVILDLTMPKLDGFGVLESVKSNPATRNIPVIILTSKDLTSAERDLLNNQADALLKKGVFSDLDLLNQVNQFLN